MSEMNKLFPAYLLGDRNGRAMAAGFYAGMRLMREKVQDALKLMTDVDAMPEWRLDEMAWELGILYDYNAEIEVKRRWIAKAAPLFSYLGTPKAIYDFLEGYFDSVQLEESGDYGGEPFHFRVTVTGEWNESNSAWVEKAIAAAKNVRSVLDEVSVGGFDGITVSMTGEVAAQLRTPLAGELLSGQWPES